MRPLNPTLRSGLPVVLALILPCAAHAAPLRVSLDGLAAPDMATMAPTEPVHARFVAAGPMPVLDKDDTEVPLIPAHDLPVAAAPEAARHAVPAAHDDGLAGSRELRDGLAGDEGGAALERPLGDFAAAAPAPSSDGGDPFEAPREAPEETPAAAALPALADVDQLRQQRMAVEWVVVPMVLAAMVMAWLSSRRGRRKKHRDLDARRDPGRSRRRGHSSHRNHGTAASTR